MFTVYGILNYLAEGARVLQWMFFEQYSHVPMPG